MVKTNFIVGGAVLYYLHTCNGRCVIFLWYQNIRLKAVEFGIKQKNRVVGSVWYYLLSYHVSLIKNGTMLCGEGLKGL